MGNMLGNLIGNGDAAQANAAVWNIPPQQGYNNPNRPYSVQMQDMVLHYGLPLMCIGMLEYQRRKSQEASQKQLHHMELEKHRQLQQMQGYDSSSSLPGSQRDSLSTMKIIIKAMEKEEDKKIELIKEQLNIYEKGLQDILDIKCSMFKDRNTRIEKQDELINNLASNEVNKVISYRDLKDIFNNDGQFCGRHKEENGKLRFLYTKQWVLQMELEKYKNIVERLKEMQSPSEIEYKYKK